MKLKNIIALVSIAITCVLGQTGVNDNSIVLGQSVALKGPAKALGKGMNTGAQAYFSYINEKGGVHGRKIKLLVADDKYEPRKTIKNTNKFINEDKVFALFGEVGTPTSKVAVPIAKEAGVPFLTPFTGAEFLRTPLSPLIVNFRGSYYSETDALVEYFTTTKGFNRIAILYQNDGYGKAGLNGVLKAMKKRGLSLVAQDHYKRNTLAIQKALKTIKAAKPDAVIMIGAYKPCATFIKQARKAGMNNTYFGNISFVGSKALIKNLKGNATNVIISQTVPLPWDTSNLAVKEYQKIFKKYKNYILNQRQNKNFV